MRRATRRPFPSCSFQQPRLPCRYIVDQILVLRICRKPPTFSTKAFSFSIFVFQLLPFCWLLIMAIVYYAPSKFGPQEPDVTLPVLVGYVIWIIALLTPLQHWMGITKPPKSLASRDARSAVPTRMTFPASPCPAVACMACPMHAVYPVLYHRPLSCLRFYAVLW